MEDAPLETIDRETVSRLLSHCDDPRGVITESFGDVMYDLARGIESERKDQAVALYTEQDLRYLLHMGVLSAGAHQGQTRQTGGDFWATHPVGATKALTEELGRTRVSLLAAGLGHDVKEDTGINDRDKFREAWGKTFKNSSDPILLASEPVLRRVWDLMRGATKIKRITREETSAATARKLLGSLRDVGLDIIHLKGADRLDNMKTIGVKSEAIGKRITEESYEVLCRIGNIIRIRRYVRKCVDLCAPVLNPTLAADFQDLCGSRMRENLDMRRFLMVDGSHVVSVREYLSSIFHDRKDVVRFEFDSSRLADFALESDEPLGALSLADLGISSLHPLYEIVVLVKPGTDIHAIITYLIHHCSQPGERRFTENANPAGELPHFGTKLHIHSRQLGILIFRINDTVSEARSKRGAVPVSSENPTVVDPVSDEMKAAIRRILRETQGDQVTRTIPLARKLLLRPNIIVFTPRGDPKSLPKDSTGLDFAASIHPGFLHGFDRVIVHESERKFREINPFDPVEDGMQIEIEKGEKLLPNPGWLIFCETEVARAALRKILRRGSPLYVSEIAGLLGIRKERIFDEVRRKRQKQKSVLNDATISHSIGVGEIEPLDLLGEGLFRDKKVWSIRVELPDEPGILRRFLGEFDEQGINVNRFLHIPRPAPQPHVIRMEIEDRTGGKTPFEMMKALLKLSYHYRVVVLSQNFFRRSMQRAGDFLMMVKNTLRSTVSI